MEQDTFLHRIKALIQAHEEGALGGEVMPEDVLCGLVPQDELPDVLTLGMSLNYQRNAYALWQSIADTYCDEGARWVFVPKEAAKAGRDVLREALLRHRVALQPNRHPDIWQRVAQGIARSSARGNVVGLIESADSDIARLKTVMQQERKRDFPYLSGPKIFNYWLYVLETYAGVRWKSRELITVAPDTHILKATVQLGLCSPDILRGAAEDRQAAADAWERALAGSGWAPIDIHTPLWLWSRAGFPALGERSAHHLFRDARLETERLIIRPYKPEDARELWAAVSSPDFYAFIPGECTPTLEEIENVIKWSVSCCERNTKEKIVKFNLAIIEKETKQVIGYCGLGPYDVDPAQTELYYGIAESRSGQGIATEAARALVNFGFEVLELEEIVTTVHPENRASVRILEKVGFRYVDKLCNLPKELMEFDGYDYYVGRRADR
ncbi:GNAT family N-acetyltransferase [Brevibacillus fluminis]|uniref:GNAT family N-acetyltransferase n=1 Tax=Brevibacillus fluminis TaxID=511487 RepID=UPI003F8A770A